jgi:hypothetical protein
MLYYKILNEFLQILEKEIISNNGIIYDKFACASLLASYNKMQYLRKKLPIDQFYDISFDKLTIDRINTSTNIKIAFKQCLDHISFYTFINNNSNIINELKISFDITISNDEPPFKTNNYICYGLLLAKNELNETKYYYSRNTGTPYDYIDNIEIKIISDITNKTTQFIRGFHSNYEIYTNIYHMIDNGWKITNLPYKLSSYSINNNHNNDNNDNNYDNNNDNNNDNDDNNNDDDNCPICLNRLKENNREIVTLYEDIFAITSNKYKIHHKCLLKFFNTQKSVIYFRCPYRYKIDYNICKYLIDYNN